MATAHENRNGTELPLGPVTELAIKSSLSPFQILLEHKVTYPPAIIKALGELYLEYNVAFGQLVDSNNEWSTDYQHGLSGPNNSPMNFAVQVDMLGLTPEFILEASDLKPEVIKERIRGMIFEIENSMAMYQFMMRGGGTTHFTDRYLSVLKEVRERHGRPIALLAVTQDKYLGMMAGEFGKQPGETITNEDVLELSGFDRLFSPDEFRTYIAANDGECEYLLYVRSSDPVSRLKDPRVIVDHPLLSDPELRRVIKANAVTFNVDAPGMPFERQINDTKGYMQKMGIAFEIRQESDLYSSSFAAHLSRGGSFAEFTGTKLSDDFRAYLNSRGVDLELAESGEIHLRAKPAKGAFGCYGHISARLCDGKRFRKELRKSIDQRGSYVVQPELETPRVTDPVSAVEYTYIDRVMLGMRNGMPILMGGFRMLLPIDSAEAKSRRIHGNGATLWAEIRS
ncbi:MAG: hypothetical protein COW24_05325 [Candidatus Kerfeldbacteria bacterium CG15_BIG_FIL_POST_REV_8_21_14_020_45_12]|uniref:Uncharacterized protein n=1 Tax=Candidatus Kerfeldbacteria bacterium CG15_BIG_FIL_POST_REV_8_21_14_020_45_12 TaxID=2014247 RepID=A0A2M7H2H5_9BACT|nr:MAG: hypothetical protein COW24_05325 [Candidatus Kerfeldbacteria bacterium CG15_BIG_FIL_POST_REV_8_21_14_020_45_12]PJA93484.1 MAG: hypothetical protein CO132_02540 [Candidatus Kerfeldbacteria bacterium CG_4_9_14_3_um_filter_45_8]